MHTEFGGHSLPSVQPLGPDVVLLEDELELVAPVPEVVAGVPPEPPPPSTTVVPPQAATMKPAEIKNKSFRIGG
jgi:hypothetical protein